MPYIIKAYDGLGQQARTISIVTRVTDIHSLIDVALIEEDMDHPDCWDALSHAGTVYTIEPYRQA